MKPSDSFRSVADGMDEKQLWHPAPAAYGRIHAMFIARDHLVSSNESYSQ
ncbi:hypothetical protein [Paraburkholderia youngii]|uniref:Uncharacterized protein n=1 Tax=Paraburkholderia youngii TaxID=2782701 RepID=A0A7Y6K252_9BURK|nr:hypothetical protein [Paraburkholderia youngii]NUY02451.1 hypothetical protein [Paraburkholderia youngii]